ncbi:PREDICTED: testis-expressed sequence 9 protein-like [Priapulus caudatus]|uniref:Testis-expressed sequence 9 protein-like n=1 Tax=Priapulus caudatus TaxID=37621 RepID=A0ABM1FA45_PRICU|nr:PREDICTED: testis-expressed sequence 9 protein-like [Priapulus caudatus]
MATRVRPVTGLPHPRGKSESLQSKEEAYISANAQLEAQTADLVREADKVLKVHDDILVKPVSLIDQLDADDFFRDEEDEDIPHRRKSVGVRKAAVGARPKSYNLNKENNAVRQETARRQVGAETDVAVPDGADADFSEAIAAIESKLKDDAAICRAAEEDDDVLPEAAAGMGPEVTVRFLKAKVRVMHEELDDLVKECDNKDQRRSEIEARLKTLEEDNAKLLKMKSSQQLQIEKQKKLAEEARCRAETLNGQLVAVKRELDMVQRSQKQAGSSQSALEVRLNRALEELEKNKKEVHKSRISAKDVSEQERKKVDGLMAEVKRLDRQKAELISAFKKQMKYISILKKQKVLLEAAKLLSFSEEEFVKALDWGSGLTKA